MSVNVGETIVLYGVLLLNIAAFTNDGWICGRLYWQRCLEASYVTLIMVGVLTTTIVLSLIVTIVQAVVTFIDSDSSVSQTASERKSAYMPRDNSRCVRHLPSLQ
ncbi:hypothetical protein EGR_10834 [Echinococcus granulosus]|nr:hypothetical protein EGR_10834 [Echinococcus granulosus]EUB54311.1 hypothetical protein EGR_10834 [Echinococcus granulosus]